MCTRSGQKPRNERAKKSITKAGKCSDGKRGTMDSMGTQTTSHRILTTHIHTAFSKKAEDKPYAHSRAASSWTQQPCDMPTVTVTFSIHSGEDMGGVVLKPCTHHMTISALSVRFLYDRRDIFGFGRPRPKDLQAPRMEYEGLPCPKRASC